MKKKSAAIKILALACAVCAIVTLIAAVSGANVTSSDPLVSLSYLNGTFKSGVMNDVNGKISTEKAALSSELTAKVNAVGSSSAPQSSASSAYQSVTLPNGSAYAVASGSEFLVLSGTVSAGAAGLTDLTDGTAVPNGGALAVNHLYVASSAASIKGAGASKILIRK